MTKRKHKPGRTKYNHKDRSKYVTNSKAYEDNYDRIFGKKNDTESVGQTPDMPESIAEDMPISNQKYKLGEMYVRAGAEAFYNDMEPIYGVNMLCYSEDEQKVWGYHGVEARSMKELGELISRLGEPSVDQYHKLLKYKALENKDI